MSIVEEIAGLKCPSCHKKIYPATYIVKTGVETTIKELIIPALATCLGLGAARPSYLVCTNKECKYCYRMDKPFFLKLNSFGKVVPVLGVGQPEPKGKKKNNGQQEQPPQQDEQEPQEAPEDLGMDEEPQDESQDEDQEESQESDGGEEQENEGEEE